MTIYGSPYSQNLCFPKTCHVRVILERNPGTARVFILASSGELSCRNPSLLFHVDVGYYDDARSASWRLRPLLGGKAIGNKQIDCACFRWNKFSSIATVFWCIHSVDWTCFVQGTDHDYIHLKDESSHSA